VPSLVATEVSTDKVKRADSVPEELDASGKSVPGTTVTPDECSVGCVGTPSVGANFEGSTTTTVLTAELRVCVVSNVTEKSKAELFDCDRTGDTGELAVELVGPEGELAVKLVSLDEPNTAEPSIVEVDCATEIWLVSTVVTALELDTVA